MIKFSLRCIIGLLIVFWSVTEDHAQQVAAADFRGEIFAATNDNNDLYINNGRKLKRKKSKDKKKICKKKCKGSNDEKKCVKKCLKKKKKMKKPTKAPVVESFSPTGDLTHHPMMKPTMVPLISSSPTKKKKKKKKKMKKPTKSPTFRPTMKPTIAPVESSLSPTEYDDVGTPIYDEEESRKYLLYTKASHCKEHAIKTWTCGSMCDNAPIVDTELVRYIPEGPTYGVQGYVARIPADDDSDDDDDNGRDSRSTKKCIVSFRGSANIQNWYANLQFLLYPWPTEQMLEYTEGDGGVDWCKDCDVHFGFAAAWDGIRNDVSQALIELDCTSLVVSGYSLGGAIASLASFDLREFMGYHVEATWTYGKPRVGNAAYSKSFVESATKQNVSPPMWRVVNYHDAVPRSPPTLSGLYPCVHPPLEVYYTNRESSDYIICPQDDPSQENASSSCMAGHPLGSTINDNHFNYLNETFFSFPSECENGQLSNGSPCNEDNDCASRRCAWHPLETDRCEAKLSNGQGCLNDKDCLSGNCGFTGLNLDGLRCKDAHPKGHGCFNDNDCLSGKCSLTFTGLRCQ